MAVNKMFGIAFGAVYVLVGLAGFAITSGVGFAANQGKDLIIFEVNPLHNIIHLAVGALLLIGGSGTLARARGVNTLVGTVYLATAALGLFLINGDMNFLALNQPDNALHLATGVLALGVALTADKSLPAETR